MNCNVCGKPAKQNRDGKYNKTCGSQQCLDAARRNAGLAGKKKSPWN